MPKKMYVARATVDGGKLISPFEKDEDAVINRAEDVTISITTISPQLYSKYAEHYKAGRFGNDFFVLLSKIGIGNQDKPTVKVHEVKHINSMVSHITDPWADTVFSLEDFGKNETTKRLYLSFHTFCQSLGGTSLDQLKSSLSEILGLAGSIFPGLAQWTSIGRVVVDGVNNILHKLINIQGETKSVAFSFFPFDSDRSDIGIQGDAPLQTGSFVLFFEETDVENLRLEDGIVRSLIDEEINPYIVVNVKNILVMSPSQLKTNAAIEVLNNYNSSYGYPLPKEREPALRYFDALKELGESYMTAQYTERYFQLKQKGNERTESENQRFEKLSQLLKAKYPEWETSTINFG